MKLAPNNFPGKAVVLDEDIPSESWPPSSKLVLGDINDEKAVIIKVDGDRILEVNNDYNRCLDGTY